MAGPGSYSRFVALLKFALPLTGLVLLAALFLVQERETMESGFVFSSADKAAINDGLTIRDPRFSGVTVKGDRFTVSAVSALPDGPNATKLSLSGVQSQTEMANGTIIELRAQSGEANLSERILRLGGGIIMSMNDAYRMTAPSGVADLETGVIDIEGPLITDGPLGRVEAGGARVSIIRSETGKVVENQLITFKNGVKVTIPPTGK